MTTVKNDLFDYKDRMIFQDDKSFKFSLDSILLAEYAKCSIKKGMVLDMCCGNMAIPLILSKYIDNEIVGFEVQKKIYELGSKSIDINNVSTLNIINDDVKNIFKYYKPETFNYIVCNPPFFKMDNINLNKNDELTIARHEVLLNLADVFNIAFKYLTSKGILFLVHRAERLDDIFKCALENKVYIKEICFIKTKVDANPSIVLLKCIKNASYGVKIRDVIDISNLKTYQNIFEEE